MWYCFNWIFLCSDMKKCFVYFYVGFVSKWKLNHFVRYYFPIAKYGMFVSHQGEDGQVGVYWIYFKHRISIVISKNNKVSFITFALRWTFLLIIIKKENWYRRLWRTGFSLSTQTASNYFFQQRLTYTKKYSQQKPDLFLHIVSSLRTINIENRP